MSQQRLQKVPATFCDVAACFSVEERKLLHEWQKELYRNVMKEIHQALSLLGPLIANSVFSLSAGDKEDVCPTGHVDFEGKNMNNLSPGFPCLNVDSNLRSDDPSSTHFLAQPDTEVGERSPSHRAGQEIGTSPVSCCIKEEGEGYSEDQCRSKITTIDHNPRAGFPFLNDDLCLRKEKEPNPSLVDPVFISEDEHSLSPGSELLSQKKIQTVTRQLQRESRKVKTSATAVIHNRDNSCCTGQPPMTTTPHAVLESGHSTKSCLYSDKRRDCNLSHGPSGH
ncbi:uncharacterized protein [Ambystoma mexicanum]|uniref:uncharacterized protein isoform X4 n=1 Tax=Ambystoma mexicanum TaxID=8296 RepID=UPI0037E8B5DE